MSVPSHTCKQLVLSPEVEQSTTVRLHNGALKRACNLPQCACLFDVDELIGGAVSVGFVLLLLLLLLFLLLLLLLLLLLRTTCLFTAFDDEVLKMTEHWR